MVGGLRRFFELDRHGTTVGREIVAGLTTFVTMAYIIVLNPKILEVAGMPFGPAMVATILTASFGTLLMGVYAKRPFAIAPYMGENAFIAFTVVRVLGYSWQTALGAIFIAGAVVQWLRDGLGIIERADQTQALAEKADPEQRVIIVPAFTGLGAPYWRPEARGAVFGLTRNSGPAEFARAALESVAFQTRDLAEAMRGDWAASGVEAELGVLRVDGGMSASDYAMQALADILGAPVDRPPVLETTALGAAWLAGNKAGLLPGIEGFAARWALERRFEPEMNNTAREVRYDAWRRAVAAAIAAG